MLFDYLDEKEIEIPEKYFEKKMFLKNQQKQIKLYNKMEEVKKDNQKLKEIVKCKKEEIET